MFAFIYYILSDLPQTSGASGFAAQARFDRWRGCCEGGDGAARIARAWQVGGGNGAGVPRKHCRHAARPTV
jgi:hypothetical protein